MANKKKSGAKHKTRGDLASALKGLGDIEKDVAKVRANLREFLVRAEKLVSGNEHLIPRTRIPRTKIRHK